MFDFYTSFVVFACYYYIHVCIIHMILCALINKKKLIPFYVIALKQAPVIGWQKAGIVSTRLWELSLYSFLKIYYQILKE